MATPREGGTISKKSFFSDMEDVNDAFGPKLTPAVVGPLQGALSGVVGCG